MLDHFHAGDMSDCLNESGLKAFSDKHFKFRTDEHDFHAFWKYTKLVYKLGAKRQLEEEFKGADKMSEDVEASLLYALWRHPGETSTVGHPVRRALKMTPSQELSKDQVIKAKSAASVIGQRLSLEASKTGKTTAYKEIKKKGKPLLDADQLADWLDASAANSADAQQQLAAASELRRLQARVEILEARQSKFMAAVRKLNGDET